MPNMPNIVRWVAWNRIKSVSAMTGKRRDVDGMQVV
jgi:hypothetical protein